MKFDDQQFLEVPRHPVAWEAASDLALQFAKLAARTSRVDMFADMANNLIQYRVSVSRELVDFVRRAGIDRYHILDLFLAELRKDMIQWENRW